MTVGDFVFAIRVGSTLDIPFQNSKYVIEHKHK